MQLPKSTVASAALPVRFCSVALYSVFSCLARHPLSSHPPPLCPPLSQNKTGGGVKSLLGLQQLAVLVPVIWVATTHRAMPCSL